ncbi:MAG: hypothetical protein FJ143_15890 [Deltaproteobacteria bacterium]|nr:hypothetical protein [Deltaproteobacteria bacterium]
MDFKTFVSEDMQELSIFLKASHIDDNPFVLCVLCTTIHDNFCGLRKFFPGWISEGGFKTRPYKFSILILRSLRPLRLNPPIPNLWLRLCRPRNSVVNKILDSSRAFVAK